MFCPRGRGWDAPIARAWLTEGPAPWGALVSWSPRCHFPLCYMKPESTASFSPGLGMFSWKQGQMCQVAFLLPQRCLSAAKQQGARAARSSEGRARRPGSCPWHPSHPECFHRSVSPLLRVASRWGWAPGAESGARPAAIPSSRWKPRPAPSAPAAPTERLPHAGPHAGCRGCPPFCPHQSPPAPLPFVDWSPRLLVHSVGRDPQRRRETAR